MIELVFLAMWNRLMNWGLAPIIATRTVAADGDVLRRLLSDPANQWRLASSFADADALQPAGERCEAQLRLPLGARARAAVQVRASRSARVVTSELQLGSRTVAWATWILVPDPGTTDVDLALQLESRSVVARLALLLGGRRWIAKRLDIALATLAQTAARVAEDFVALSAADVVPSAAAGGKQDFAVEPAYTR